MMLTPFVCTGFWWLFFSMKSEHTFCWTYAFVVVFQWNLNIRFVWTAFCCFVFQLNLNLHVWHLSSDINPFGHKNKIKNPSFFPPMKSEHTCVTSVKWCSTHFWGHVFLLSFFQWNLNIHVLHLSSDVNTLCLDRICHGCFYSYVKQNLTLMQTNCQ